MPGPDHDRRTLAGGAGATPMQLRTFRGKSMAEALIAVKRELGADALIVHTRTFKVGGVLGVGAKEEVEIVASPMAPAPPAPPRTRPIAPAQIAERLRNAYAAPEAPVEPPPAPRPTRQVVEPTPTVMQVRPRPAAAVTPAQAAAPVARLAITPPAAATTDLHGELGAIKDMVSQLLASGVAPKLTSSTAHPARAAAAGVGGNDPLAEWYLRLLSNAVSRELAEKIVEDVRRRLGSGVTSDQAARDAIRACIAAQIRTAKEPLRLPADGEPRPRTIALVGTTGVGKTTTVAKLAAQAKLTHRARVGVITCDINRIGAIEQLRTYADVVGASFRVAASAAEMFEARQSLGDIDLLLIDTPGLSPRDPQGINALGSLIDAAPNTEVHLALPTSGSEASLLGMCRAFAPLRPTRLLFTKTDEAVSYGVILSVASQVSAELSYLTSGPRIPEQIETPDPYRLADLIAAA